MRKELQIRYDTSPNPIWIIHKDYWTDFVDKYYKDSYNTPWKIYHLPLFSTDPEFIRSYFDLMNGTDYLLICDYDFRIYNMPLNFLEEINHYWNKMYE